MAQPIKAITNLLSDTCPLLLAIIAVSAVSMLLGLPTAAYVRVGIFFFLFLLPGWFIAGAWDPDAGFRLRVFLASVVSFCSFSILAQLCTWTRLTFDAFYVLWSFLMLAATVAALVRIQATGRPSMLACFDWRSVVGTSLVVAFLVLAYRVPYSNDVSQFTLQQQDMALARSFQPSAIGMTAFGMTEPMPRWHCHAFHVFFSVMADATNLPVLGIVYQWATIPMAILAYLAIFVFIRGVVGWEIPAWAIVGGIFASIIVFWQEHNVYSLSFRLTNNLCLDKDFALFFVLPAMLTFTIGILRQEDSVSQGNQRVWRRGQWIALAALMAPALNFHPMTSIYFVMTLPILLFGFWSALQWKSVVYVVSVAVLMLAVVFGKGDASGGHRQINELARIDMDRSAEGRPLHYWVGHYGAIEGYDTGTIVWRDGRMKLRSELFTRNTVLAGSAILTAVWLVLFATRRRLTAWKQEAFSLRIQIGYLLGLVAIWCAAPMLLARAGHLYRGVERLHWYYLGFFSFVFVLAYLDQAIQSMASRSDSVWLRRAGCGVLPAMLALFLVDQSIALHRDATSMVSHMPYVHTAFDVPSVEMRALMNRNARRRLGQTGTVPQCPLWLEPTDRVLWLAGSSPSRFWLMKQSVWWRELYAEAYVYADRGQSFLDESDAFYDGVDHILSDRFLRWFANNGVTIVVCNDAVFIQQLADAVHAEAKQLEQHVWRLSSLQNPQD